MKLNRKHIGQLFDNHGADGSWCYQLVAIKRGRLLFYDFHGGYVLDSNKYADWRHFQPVNPFPANWIKYGWTIAKE